MRTRWFVGLTGAALGLLGIQASAHHGWGGQQQEQFELTGKLQTDVSLAGRPWLDADRRRQGPGVGYHVGAGGAHGGAGLKPGVIPMGATVTISGNRNSDMQRFEVKTERVTHEGKNYDVYPDRI